MPAAGEVLEQERRHGVEEHQLLHESRVAVEKVAGDGAAEVTGDHAAPLVAEHIVDEQVQVAAPGGEVVHVLGRHVRIAVAAQVGGDHLVAGVGKRADVAPPDALRLGVSVDQKQRISADAFVHECQRQPVAILTRRHLAAMDRERVRSGCVGLRWPQTQVVVHDSESAAVTGRICPDRPSGGRTRPRSSARRPAGR